MPFAHFASVSGVRLILCHTAIFPAFVFDTFSTWFYFLPEHIYVLQIKACFSFVSDHSFQTAFFLLFLWKRGGNSSQKS